MYDRHRKNTLDLMISLLTCGEKYIVILNGAPLARFDL